MGAPARCVQLLAVLLFLGTAFVPLHVPEQHPLALARGLPPRPPALPAPALAAAIPARDLCDAALLDLTTGAPGSRLWEVRRWYPYALAPLWLVALLLVGVGGPAAERRRAWVGPGLVLVSVALVVLEACYLGAEYLAILPGVWGRIEVVFAWLVVVGILSWRRPPDRALGAVEAHVGAQALLCLVHLFTLPSSEARGWIGAYAWGDILGALGVNFRPAFWLACLGLTLASASTYLTRRRASA